jgi:hypothetical protein
LTNPWKAYVLLAPVFSLAAGYLLAFARISVIEASPMLFGLGIAYATGAPRILRWLGRRV